MRILAFLTFTSCIALSQLSSAKSSSHQPDVVQGKKKCEEYVSYEECVKQATATTAKCRRSNSSHLNVDKICTDFDQKLKKLCSAHSGKASCLECFDKLEEAVERCKNLSEMIHCKNNITVTECEEMKASLTSYCSSKECDVCKDLYCRNGGKCAGPSAVWCTCLAGYTGAFCQKKGKSKCAAKPRKNGGTCIGDNRCKCPPSFYGAQCDRTSRLGTKENPAPNAQAILDAGESQGSGMYWIQPPNETARAETYCDMSFAGGRWMLASYYGYVHTPNENVNNKDNKAIPNMNNPFGYSWLPNRRSSSNGVINLPHGAVKIANNANYMIMAAGNNPASGGIDQYAYVYRIFLSKNPYKVTFLNHNLFNGGQQGRMHVTKFVVEALKGESGTYVRFALGEALEVTWSDSYPTGYGFNDKNSTNGGFNKGPFFPSVHSGSGRSPCSFCTPTNFKPDVPGGNPHYTHRGWYTANGYGKTGQTSIWFK